MMFTENKIVLSVFVLSFAALFLTGCGSIQYDGISDSPLPSDAPVMVFYDKSQIGTNDFSVLGTAVLEASPNASRRDIQEKLIKFARKHGANGVLFISIDQVKASEAREDQIYNRNAPGWGGETVKEGTSTTSLWDTIYYSSGKDEEKAVYKTVAKAELLSLSSSMFQQMEFESEEPEE